MFLQVYHEPVMGGSGVVIEVEVGFLDCSDVIFMGVQLV